MGTGGGIRVLSLVSGGIDSPVATALALDGGAEVVCLHFIVRPMAEGKSAERVAAILQTLAKRSGKKIKLVLVPFAETAHSGIAEKAERKFACILCRRLMFRVAEAIAEGEKCSALLTGESLGQVASQTLDNLTVAAGATKMPVLRPLLGMDKLEIERLSRKYGLFPLSAKAAEGCPLVPEKPATKSNPVVIGREEKKMETAKIVENAVNLKRVVFVEP